MNERTNPMTNETEAPERMMEKVDISPEAVETRALCHDQFVGCDYDLTMTQDGHQKTASTLRAQAARIAELEAAYQAARDETYRMAVTATEANARAEAAEANLAEAVDVDLIEQCIRDVLDEGGTIRSAAEYVARATLAELKATDTERETQ